MTRSRPPDRTYRGRCINRDPPGKGFLPNQVHGPGDTVTHSEQDGGIRFSAGRRSDRGPQTAVVFISNRLHDSVKNQFEKLRCQVPPGHDVYLAYDKTNADVKELDRVRDLAGDRLRTFDFFRVTDFDYPNPWEVSEELATRLGNLDLLYLHISRIEPGYSRYWFVESDVAYTGSWSEFFRAFSDSTADLMGTTLRPYEDNPDWYWWPSLETVPELESSEWLRGFFPVVRLSRDLLDVLDEAYRAGWAGHFEAVLPTVARRHGLELEDIGGDGPYVRTGNRNRFYTNTPERDSLAPGTFVYRPARPRPGAQSGKLYHPIKSDRGYFRSSIRLLRQWVEAQVMDQR